MESEIVTFKETVELFVLDTFMNIWNEYEVPRVNFIFDEKAYAYFNYVKDHPFIKPNCYTPNIETKDIENIKNHYDPNVPTIIVKDFKLFFFFIKEIVNSYVSYNQYPSARAILLNLMKRIWLRMSPCDFNNVEDFLKKQLMYIRNNFFDEEFKEMKKIDKLNNYTVYAQVNKNATYYETSRNMAFYIEYRPYMFYDLPAVHYEMGKENEEDVCYIYAVQNRYNLIKNNKVVHELYKINANVENLNCHPRHIYSLILFITILLDKGVNKIKIPTLQVLSYRYHELLSKSISEKFNRDWTDERIKEIETLPDYMKQGEQKRYEDDKEVYNRFVNKEDIISMNKTEKLIDLVKIMEYHFPDLEFNYDFDNQDWMVEINRKNLKLK